jgi:hypothetical protein
VDNIKKIPFFAKHIESMREGGPGSGRHAASGEKVPSMASLKSKDHRAEMDKHAAAADAAIQAGNKAKADFHDGMSYIHQKLQQVANTNAQARGPYAKAGSGRVRNEFKKMVSQFAQDTHNRLKGET